MVTLSVNAEEHIIDLSEKSFKAFCSDISGMFGVEMECIRQEVCNETIEGLKKRFGEIAAVNTVKAEGALAETFQLIFDRGGLFILAGIVAAPEQTDSSPESDIGQTKILENIKSGTLKEAEGMSDTIAEAGNMLVGAWDKVFREALEGHGHFAQGNTFIGEPWDKPEETIGLGGDEEFTLVPYEMTIKPYPAFCCGVIFPKGVFEATSESDAEAAEAVEEKGENQKADTVEEKGEDEKVDAAEEKSEDQKEGEVKEESEAAVEAKGDGSAAEAADSGSEQEAATSDATEEGKESATGEVSEAIQKMSQSAAVLPGEGEQAETASAGGTSLSICAKDIMQKEVVWGNGDDSVQQSLAKIEQHGAGYMLVGREEKAEGIVSKSDLTGAISPYLRPVFSKWRRPLDDATLQIKIKWIMSKPIHMVKLETPIWAIMEKMGKFGGRCLPVVDEEGKVQGLVTIFDIFKALLRSGPENSTTGSEAQSPPST